MRSDDNQEERDVVDVPLSTNLELINNSHI